MKCKVKDCENHTDQGVFVGFLCMPCYTFLNTGEGAYSQLYRNTVEEEREACAKICDEKAKEWPEMRGWLDDFSNEIAAAIRERGAP